MKLECRLDTLMGVAKCALKCGECKIFNNQADKVKIDGLVSAYSITKRVENEFICFLSQGYVISTHCVDIQQLLVKSMHKKVLKGTVVDAQTYITDEGRGRLR